MVKNRKKGNKFIDLKIIKENKIHSRVVIKKKKKEKNTSSFKVLLRCSFGNRLLILSVRNNLWPCSHCTLYLCVLLCVVVY